MPIISYTDMHKKNGNHLAMVQFPPTRGDGSILAYIRGCIRKGKKWE